MKKTSSFGIDTRKFTSHGRKYVVDGYGVVHQENPRPFRYDAAYVSAFEKPEYRAKTLALTMLRLGWVMGLFNMKFGHAPESLLDIGYGSGTFMREAAKVIYTVDGCEIAPLPVPEGCHKVEAVDRTYDIVTFMDSLEHHRSLDVISRLNASLVAISVPWCHEPGGPWFDAWKHRKPDEHLHHFDVPALAAFMASEGWTMIYEGHHEDVIRRPVDDKPNILSMAFVSRHASTTPP